MVRDCGPDVPATMDWLPRDKPPSRHDEQEQLRIKKAKATMSPPEKSLPGRGSSGAGKSSGTKLPLVVAGGALLVLIVVGALTMRSSDKSGGSGKQAAPTEPVREPRRPERRAPARVQEATPAAREAPLTDPAQPPPATEPTPSESAGLEWQVGNGPLVRTDCHWKLIVNPGFATVLQLASYPDPDHETFPSFFQQVQVTTTSVSELVNRRWPAIVHLQLEKDGKLLHNLPGQLVELVVSKVEDRQVHGTFAGQVHDIDGGNDSKIQGRFRAVLDAPAPKAQ